jgi:hypothetical protein
VAVSRLDDADLETISAIIGRLRWIAGRTFSTMTKRGGG